MSFSEEKKRAVIRYILEKIPGQADGLSKTVAAVFSMNQNTVHRYLNELIGQGVIRRVGRGRYELTTQTFRYTFFRSKGELESDTYAYDAYLAPLLKSCPQNVVKIWQYAMSEMMNNVIDHSQAECVELTIQQNSVQTEVKIWDHGIGIFRKIQEHFRYASLDDAICELFKGKLTTDSSRHSGEGIFFSSRMMDEFFIVSDSKIFYTDKYDMGVITEWTKKEPDGTFVHMCLSNHSNRTSREVFDAYADVDGDFTKTGIPLKNVYDGSPVSRSQAKRLYSRLDHFSEVTLDFDGLDWMGQAFAHELFVVFVRQHPEITLHIENMNTDVQRMYRHVTGSGL